MTSALPFLASLAPASVGADAASYVHAARPPRFAAIQEEALSDSPPVLTGPESEEAEADAPASDTRPAPATVAPIGPQPKRQRAQPQPPLSHAQRTTVVARESSAVVPMPVAQAHTPSESHVTREGQPARAARAEHRIVRETPRHAPAQLHILSRPSLIIERAPLREGVRSEGIPAERPQAAPPIVHVTIDRIDVRAPASPPPVAQPARPRRGAAQSLSDYLRRGSPGSEPAK